MRSPRGRRGSAEQHSGVWAKALVGQAGVRAQSGSAECRHRHGQDVADRDDRSQRNAIAAQVHTPGDRTRGKGMARAGGAEVAERRRSNHQIAGRRNGERDRPATAAHWTADRASAAKRAAPINDKSRPTYPVGVHVFCFAGKEQRGVTAGARPSREPGRRPCSLLVTEAKQTASPAFRKAPDNQHERRE
jgi:hypothetical protein